MGFSNFGISSPIESLAALLIQEIIRFNKSMLKAGVIFYDRANRSLDGTVRSFSNPIAPETAGTENSPE